MKEENIQILDPTISIMSVIFIKIFIILYVDCCVGAAANNNNDIEM